MALLGSALPATHPQPRAVILGLWYHEAMAPPPHPKSGPARFVGRSAEIAALDAALEAARSGYGGVALLAGEPGIGKTRLADELSERAAAQGALVLWGRCYEGAGAPAFWPWV